MNYSKNYLQAFKIICLAYIGTMISSIVTTSLNPNPTLSNDNPVLSFGLITVALFLAPIMEELFYRNILIGWRPKFISISVALIISSMLFALSHNDIWLLPYAINGWIYGIVFILYPKNYYHVYVHFLYNLTVIIYQSLIF